MPSYTGQREQDLALRVRRMLIEQSALLQDESPDEFTWLTRHYETEQRFFEEELGARLELRLGRWARAYWPAPPRNRELCIADIFELTARKQTAYACLIRAYRSVRLLESGDSASVFRFSELFRYVAEEGQRLSPWLSFDEAVINEALATQGDAEADADEDEDEELATAGAAKGRKRATSGATSRGRKTSTAAPQRAGAAQRVRANQRAFYQAFAAFERHRLTRRIGADDRQRPEERYRLNERDFSGVYEFTDLIDRFLPPAGLVAYDDLKGEEE
ncbi:MAG TPA: hypothetical protein VFX31_03545 [Ktedonobacterales bacterium]|jgi:hypothetical protein|nr:hypothetical protein [Ktedonobacterales bacterium]HEX5570433.1 hypothetical protein [Ktedonobacterales bacterium]